jgi:ChpA-C
MLTATFATAGAGFPAAAFAASGGGGGGSTSGLGSVLGGNQVNAPISVPADVCGNAAAVLGLGLAGCQGGASVGGTSTGTSSAGGAVGAVTSGHGPAGGGNQVSAPVSLPVNGCGNAIDNAVAGCPGGSSVSGGGGSGSGAVTSGHGSVGGGNQVSAPASVPADVCGNSAAVLGDSLAGCEGTASVSQTAWSSSGREAGRTGTGGTQPGPGGSIAGSLPPGLDTLPVTSALNGLPSHSAPSTVTDLAAPAADSAPATAGGPGAKPLPANTLAADSSSGLGSVSFYSLAIGALLAGAVALKLAGRRIRGRHFRGHQA